MKKLATLAFAILLTPVFLAVGGCGFAGNPSNTSKSLPNNAQVQPGSTRVTVFDVGKGDCILVQTSNAAALIDTGYDETADDVVPFLLKQGIDHLDYLVITHYDKDHVGGVRAIGNALDIGTVFLPAYEGADKHYHSTIAAIKDLGLSTQTVSKTTELTLDEAAFAIFPSGVSYDPDAKGDEGNDNDMSLVVTLTSKGDSYLFAGDLEEEGVDAYLKGGHGTFGVLKVPHHGEKASNTGELLAQVQPKIALITDSEDEPASKKTLKALDKAAVPSYCTSDCGSIAVVSDGAGHYTVTTDVS